jgi:hypothetical protein
MQCFLIVVGSPSEKHGWETMLPALGKHEAGIFYDDIACQFCATKYFRDFWRFLASRRFSLNIGY